MRAGVPGNYSSHCVWMFFLAYRGERVMLIAPTPKAARTLRRYLYDFRLSLLNMNSTHYLYPIYMEYFHKFQSIEIKVSSNTLTLQQKEIL